MWILIPAILLTAVFLVWNDSTTTYNPAPVSNIENTERIYIPPECLGKFDENGNCLDLKG